MLCTDNDSSNWGAPRIKSLRMWPDKDTRAPDMGAHSRVPTPAEMADRFADADADGSGTIDMDELQTILPVEYSRAQLETTFRKYDADGSGALGLDEFKMLVIDLERELISRELMDRGAKVFIYFQFFHWIV